ncbi:hypothetical protein PHMEG_00040494 [Phytophthora megakarya]|uniref:Uncharacterized protein n=1 Tax=Phytophthora megakarya TaxID=4795 RepID=A0A225UDU3_9STRA|nr:hypothetical protein PHMEG_00040494 [Phytophthora megakarya]
MGFHPVELLLLVEALGIFTERHTYCLRTVNAFYSDKHGVRVTYHAADTDVALGGQCMRNATGDPLLCPIKALRHIYKARQELKCEGERCSKRSLCRKNSYSTHSIRIEGATALLSGKVDSLSIKLLGRWMSDCFEEYPVQAAQATIGLSCRMI